MDIVWSPDGSRLLYTAPEWERPRLDARYPMEYSGPPCVLDLTAGASECFEGPVSAHFPAELHIVDKEVVVAQWDRRADGFFYTYQGTYLDFDDQGNPGDYLGLDGLCHLDILARHVDCPSEDLPELRGQLLGRVELSPDEEFAYVQSGRDGLRHGVLELGSRQFYQLPVPAGARNLDDLESVDVLWRPSAPVERPVAVNTSRPTERDIELVSSIWNVSGLLQQLDLVEPGVRQFSTELDAGQTLIWPYFWCASNEQRLVENLRWITAEFAIDGIRLTAEDILEYELDSEEWSCHYWATMLTGWQSGSELSLAVQLAFARTVYDGYANYPAGDYRYELRVTVSE